VPAFSAFDESCMRRGIALAERGLYTTEPNPRVGCVIARGTEIVGEGWHRRAGEAHAEVLALAQSGERARGATVYVTLEPCNHYGRTPPCVDALIRAGVGRVICAEADPNPRVNGGGIERLRSAGIEVDVGLLADAAHTLNPGFLKRHASGRPWVRVKLAMSLDGRTALASGESRWITGEEARADVQHWRARSSAVVTGVGTVLADDPRLDARHPSLGDQVVQPLRVVLDSHGRMRATARILAPPGECWICVGPGEASSAGGPGVAVRELPMAQSGLDLTALLAMLVEREANEVWVEAGPSVAGAFIREGLVDELVLYVAPRLLGSDARPLVVLPAIERIADGPHWRYTDVRQIGADLRIIAIPQG
jgi:diaminohydroxyphosphoribosylaminopyrimidine deaminase/5-amino-6-(5-phosphoribosylamino)uracil reductase